MKKIPLMLKTIFSALMLFSAAALPAEEEISPLTHWKNGYENFDRGEQCRGRGHYIDALNAFKAARANYLAVKQARPDWNLKLINARIESCDIEIAKMESLITPSASGSAPASGTSRKSDALPEKTPSFDSTAQELEEYKNRLFKALVELEDVKKEAAQIRKSADNVQNLMREYRTLQGKYDTLKQSYDALKKKNPSEIPPETAKKLLDMKITIEMMNRKFEAAGKEFEATRTALQRSENEAASLRRQLAGKNSENQENEAELKALREFKRTSAAAANKQLEELAAMKQLNADLQKELAAEKEKFQAISRKLASPSASTVAENSELRNRIIAKDREINALKRTVSALQSDLREQMLEYNLLKTTVQSLDNSRKKLEEALLIQRDDYEKKLKNNRTEAGKNAALAAEKEALSQEVANWMKKCASLEKRFETLSVSGKQLSDTLAAENKQLADELAKLKTDMAMLRSENTTLSAENKAVSDESRAVRVKLLAVTADLRELKKLKTDHAALLKELALLRQAKQQFDREQADFTRKRAELARYETLQKELTAQQKKNQSLLDANAKIQQLADQQKQQISALQSENKKLATRPQSPPSPASPAAANDSAPASPVTALNIAAARAERKGDTAAAIESYRQVLKLAPGDFQANSRLGRILLKQGKFAEAEPLLVRAKNRYPGNFELILDTASALIGVKNAGGAIAVLQELGPAASRNADCLILLGKAKMLSGDTAGAFEALKTADQLRNDDGGILLLLAKLSGDEQQGAAFYRRAKQLGNFTDPELEKRFANINEETNDTLKFLKQAAGEAERERNFDTAVWYYRQLLEMDSKNHGAKSSLAALLAYRNENEGALQLLHDQPDNKENCLIRAAAYASLGNYTEADKFLAQASRQNDKGKWKKRYLLFSLISAMPDRLRLAAPKATVAGFEAFQK